MIEEQFRITIDGNRSQSRANGAWEYISCPGAFALQIYPAEHLLTSLKYLPVRPLATRQLGPDSTQATKASSPFRCGPVSSLVFSRLPADENNDKLKLFN